MTYRYVYLLRCRDGKIYTGNTSNLNRRLTEHELGRVYFTRTRLPVELITYIGFSNRLKAYDFERYLKSGSGKAFSKKRLI